MKTRVLVAFEIEGKPEDAHTVVDALLDNGDFQDSINGHNVSDAGNLTVRDAWISTLEDDLREILWPKDDPGRDWSADTLDQIHECLKHLAPKQPAPTLEAARAEYATETAAGNLHETDADCVRAGYVDDDGHCQVCGVSGGVTCPECGGERFHVEGCPESDETLPSTIDKPEVGDRALAAFKASSYYDDEKDDARAFFEHGHWWVEVIGSGAQYSVVDAAGGRSIDGFDFEMVTAGDDE